MAAAMTTLIINANGNVRNLTVPSDCTIRFVMEECIANAIMPNTMELDGFYLVYNGKSLLYDTNQTLQTYAIEHMSTLSVCMRVIGGSRPLQALPGEVTPTKEQCAASLDADQDEWRAKMKCGHVLSVESMVQYIRSALNDGQAVFSCGICKGNKISFEWKYSAIRHVITYGLTPDELCKIDDQFNENGLKNESEIKRCPQCDSMCQRSDWETTREGSSNRVTCTMCLKKGEAEMSKNANHNVAVTKRVFDFCWSCGKTWVDMSSQGACGNAGCDGLTRLDRRTNDLANCETKKIGKVDGCPKLRACVVCNFLVYHNTACKHVQCTRCGTEFCFICLKPKQNENWQCGHYSDPCRVAPRQKLDCDRKFTPIVPPVRQNLADFNLMFDQLGFYNDDEQDLFMPFAFRSHSVRDNRPPVAAARPLHYFGGYSPRVNPAQANTRAAPVPLQNQLLDTAAGRPRNTGLQINPPQSHNRPNGPISWRHEIDNFDWLLPPRRRPEDGIVLEPRRDPARLEQPGREEGIRSQRRVQQRTADQHHRMSDRTGLNRHRAARNRVVAPQLPAPPTQ